MNNFLEVKDLTIKRETPHGEIALVKQLNYFVGRGEILGVVGESGSGKSLSSMSLLGLVAPPLTVTGQLSLNGVAYDLGMPSSLSSIRGREIGIIFQDPRTALNPVRTVGAHFFEVLRQHRRANDTNLKQETLKLLSATGVGDAERRLSQYPHQLSGGLCQRVMIALVLASHPKVLIADEPTTALDTTVQAQVLDLIDHIRKEEGMAVIFISHDLAVVGDIADRIAIMRNGTLIETTSCQHLFDTRQTAYAQSLIDLSLSRRHPSQLPRAVDENAAP